MSLSISNLDELVLLVIPLSDAKEDECFNPGGNIDEIDAFLDINVSMDIEDSYHDSKGDIIYSENDVDHVDQPNGSAANNNTTDVLKVHIGDVNGSPMLKEDDPKVKAFANVVEGANGAAKNDNTKKKINIRTLISEDKEENSNFVLPIESIEIVKNKFANSLVGFFVGKGIAFPLVQICL
ncbi:hypothetical protein Tco_0087548 [Tanacetum coccineum]